MGLRVTVVIPRIYLLNRLNIASEQDIALYEECIAFAFTDRLQLDDLQFDISDEAENHEYRCVATDPRDMVPSENDFSTAMQSALERYKLMKTGDPIMMRKTTKALDYLFTPLMTTRDTEEGPSEDDESE